jgi:hypothetical protein
MGVHPMVVVLQLDAHRIHVPEIVHHVPEIVLIRAHLIGANVLTNVALGAVVAMIAPVQPVTFPMVAQ